MVQPERQVRGGALVAVVHWGLFLVYCVLALVAVSVLTVAALFALNGVEGGLELAVDPEALGTDPTLLGVSTAATVAAMALGGVVAGMFLPTEEGRFFGFDPSPEGVARTLGIHRFHPAWLIAAVVATGMLGMLPGWGAQQLMELAPDSIADPMSSLGDVLTDIHRPGWIWMALAVVVAAPVFEESIFRGYLWRAAEHGLPRVGVWIATSALFAAYHMNPIHVVSVFPIGLFFGWLRWKSGSIWPSMAAHFVNNMLALILSVWLGSESEANLPLALAGTVAGLGVAAGTWRLARPAAEEQ